MTFYRQQVLIKNNNIKSTYNLNCKCHINNKKTLGYKSLFIPSQNIIFILSVDA